MRMPRYPLAVALAVVCLAAPLTQDAAPALTPEEMEAFLLNADLSDLDRLDVGVDRLAPGFRVGRPDHARRPRPNRRHPARHVRRARGRGWS